jgi:hypothetical protein
MAEFRCEGWEAVHDLRPEGPHALKVTGSCRAPQEGWTFRPHRTGDPGGRRLRLRLDVDRPQVAPERETPVHVEFVTFTDAEVDAIEIEGVEDEIPVHVER